jgi:hypothetical protein
MTKTLLLAAAGLSVALTAAPADAKRYTNHVVCKKYRNGRCVDWHRMTVAQARRAGYRVGYAFGPNYAYTDYSALPQPIVTRYHLRNNWRYVNQDGYVYVVNPRTYRVVRVINVPM